MKKLAGILCAFVLAPGANGRLDAQVTIVRTLPPSSVPEVPAQWNAPQPEPQTALATGRTQLSGRVSLGGSAGTGALGDFTYGFTTDSRISLIQRLGQAATLQIDGKALRKNALDGLQQAYATELAMVTQKLSLSAAGSFSLNETSVGGVSTTTTDAAIKAAASTTFMPALPISLSYLHNWKQGEAQTASGLPVQSDSAKFMSIGTIGRLGIEVSGAFDRGTDVEKDLQTMGANGRVQITVPALPFLSILARVSPGTTRTVYTGSGGTTASTSLESNLGLLFPVSDAVQLALIAGRVDTWSASEGIADALPPYQVSWNGELGAEVRNLSGFSASPAWKIAKTVGGNLSNTLSLDGSWTATNEGFLTSARAAGELSFVNGDSGGFLESRDAWNVGVTMTPLEKMSLSASTSGSFEGGPGSAEGSTWSYKAGAQLSHEPDPLLSYKAGAAVSGRYTIAGTTLNQEYTAGVNLKPRRNLRQYLFGLAETFTISTEALSKASFTTSVPITAAVNARYAIDWEWIDHVAAGAEAGHNFRHLLAVAASGEKLPVSFNAEYAFSHGYRGFRHDLNAGLRFPFSDAIVLEGALAFASYEEGGAPRLPFLFSLGLAYEF